ncbi:larval cuticle protein LCP-30-like [Achroia grisella]|uniref:larval cuticle protein LCP-30-like n=1 Tax=Achroia grisella TaxID=688607 RepID=UPI0027D31546|nr:larval cuticle protein LCP-30-like [Achroia grisella]
MDSLIDKCTVKYLFVQFAVLVFGVVTSNAQDDGRYRPGSYGGDDGRYRPSAEGQYSGSYSNRNDNRYNYASGVNYNNLYGRSQSRYGLKLVLDKVLFRNSLIEYHQLKFFFSYSQNAAAYPSVAVTAAPPSYYQQESSYARPLQASYVRSQSNEQNARILKQDSQLDIDGYQYYYQTDNGINAEEAGKLQSTASGPGIRASGFYEYVGDDGVTYRVDYTADENGFHPSGAHLPQIPRV